MGLFGVATLWAPSLLPKPVCPPVIHLGLADWTEPWGVQGPGSRPCLRAPESRGQWWQIPGGDTAPGLCSPAAVRVWWGLLTQSRGGSSIQTELGSQPGLASGTHKSVPTGVDGALPGSRASGRCLPRPSLRIVLSYLINLCLFLCAKQGATSETSEAAEGWLRLAGLAPNPRAPHSRWDFQSSGAQSGVRS